MRATEENRGLAFVWMQGIAAVVHVCPQDPQSLTRVLGDHDLQLSKLVISSDPPDMENLQELIQEIRTAGIGYNTPPMRELHQKLARAHLFHLNITACLQVMLEIYHLIETSSIPSLLLTERLGTLHTLFSRLTLQEDGLLNSASLPPLYLKHQLNILVHLRAKIVRHTERCFGADSKATKNEKETFLAWIEELIFDGKGKGSGFVYTPLEISQGEQAKFVEGVDDLLAWAGFGVKSLDQLLF